MYPSAEGVVLYGPILGITTRDLAIKKLLKKLFGKRKTTQYQPLIIPRTQHRISRQDISPNALKVLYRLHDAGYAAYMVGGGVRDLLLGHAPKDFDIATDARPEEVKKLFRSALLIGRRFRLVHVRFGREIVEVATFRGGESNKSHKQRTTAEHGMLLRDNVYGTLEEDAWRRDFTVNALYYNIADHSVVDYCGGIKDLETRTLRIIGDPEKRYQEDPVRLLRTIRFAGKLGLNIEAETAKPIIGLAPLLQHVPPARLFDEALKLFHCGQALATFKLLRDYHLFAELFPQAAACLIENDLTEKILEISCKNTDARIHEQKTVSPAFLFASVLWQPMQKATQKFINNGLPTNIAQDKAIHEVLSKQIKRISIPRRFSMAVREIWQMQYRFARQQKHQVIHLIGHPRFRAAYDFLLLRTEAGEISPTIADWWTDFTQATDEVRKQMLEKLPKPKKRRKKK